MDQPDERWIVDTYPAGGQLIKNRAEIYDDISDSLHLGGFLPMEGSNDDRISNRLNQPDPAPDQKPHGQEPIKIGDKIGCGAGEDDEKCRGNG